MAMAIGLGARAEILEGTAESACEARDVSDRERSRDY